MGEASDRDRRGSRHHRRHHDDGAGRRAQPRTVNGDGQRFGSPRVGPRDRCGPPRPYNAATAGDPTANAVDATLRSIQTAAVDNAVAATTGADGTDLPAANGVVASVTPDQLAALEADPALVVTPNAPVAMADAAVGAAVAGLTST